MPLTDSLGYAKAQLRRAEHLRNAGRIDAAYYVILRVLDSLRDHGEETAVVYFKPRIYHQLALIHASRGDHEAAEAYFKRSMKEFDPDNFIGRGRVTRDYGWWLYTNGGISRGRNQIKAARKLLMQDTGSPTRREREIAVTDGFLARCGRVSDPEKARKAMLQVDEMLRGGEKWIYELDNLKFLIPLLPLSSRPLYVARARTIELKILLNENLAILAEDIRNGKPIKALTSFGVRSLKSLL